MATATATATAMAMAMLKMDENVNLRLECFVFIHFLVRSRFASFAQCPTLERLIHLDSLAGQGHKGSQLQACHRYSIYKT